MILLCPPVEMKGTKDEARQKGGKLIILVCDTDARISTEKNPNYKIPV